MQSRHAPSVAFFAAFARRHAATLFRSLPRGLSLWAAVIVAACFSAAPAMAQSVSLYTAVDLALRNSPEVRMADAEVRRAQAGLAETRAAYIPGFTFGSNIGYSYGFPVGTPSVLNVQSNSLAFSFSQRDYIRSAKASLEAAQESLKDARQKVALEVSLDYTELSADEQELATMDQEQQAGQRLIQIEEDRFASGVDSRIDLTEARLADARLTLQGLQIEGNAALLAAKIAHYDGLPAEPLTTEAKSIPEPPTPAMLHQAGSPSAALLAADAQARSKLYVAFGDSRQEYHPSFALGLNYSRFAEFNNYQEYYNRFQHNNFGIGLNITIPLFDQSRHDHARGSAADAVRAEAQAQQDRNQLSEAQLQIDRNLATLDAQQKVASLEQELAQEKLDALKIQLQDGSGTPGVPPPTPKDQQEALISESRYTIDLLDANLQLLHAQLNLLRMKGLIDTWALSQPANP